VFMRQGFVVGKNVERLPLDACPAFDAIFFQYQFNTSAA